MKTYEVVLMSEALISVKVSARSPEEANELALSRASQLLTRLEGRYKRISFGDLQEYISAAE